MKKEGLKEVKLRWEIVPFGSIRAEGSLAMAEDPQIPQERPSEPRPQDLRQGGGLV